MKSILLFVNDIHFKGGGERVATNISNHYSRHGYKVTLLSMSPKMETLIFPIEYNVEVAYLHVYNSRFCSKIKVFIKLRDYLSNNHFDFVLGIGTYSNVLLGFARNPKTKFIGCEHNAFDSVSSLWNLLRKLSYRKLDATVVLTSADLVKMKNLNKKTYVISNSINENSKQSNLDSRRILAIGKLYHQKGFDIMIDMFSVFCRKNTDWNLVIIGDGENRIELLNKIEVLKLRNRISIIDPTDEIEAEYLKSGVYLMTSRFEGLPMVLLEAQSFGLPIVSFDCKTGPSDIVINGRNGILVPCFNINIMVDSLLEICSSEKLRKEMGENAKKDASRFYPNIIYRLWDNLFSDLS